MKSIKIEREDYRRIPKRNQEWEKYILQKYLPDLICMKCDQIIKYEHLVKITKTGIFLRSVDEQICCSKSCSASLTNLKNHKNEPERGRKFNKLMSFKRNELGFEKFYKNPEAVRKTISARNSKDNPKWHSSHSIEKRKEISQKASIDIINRMKGKTLEEIYGKEKGEEIKKKISMSVSGEKNPMFGKPSSYFSGGGITGKYKNFHFRSLLELSYILEMESKGIELVSAENSKFRVKYIVDNVMKNYFPDFYVPSTDTVVEIKPSRYLSSKINKTKFDSANKTFSNFSIITEKDIENLISIEKLKELIVDKDIKISNNSKKRFNL